MKQAQNGLRERKKDAMGRQRSTDGSSNGGSIEIGKRSTEDPNGGRQTYQCITQVTEIFFRAEFRKSSRNHHSKERQN